MAPLPVSPAALTCPRCGTPNREDAWFCNLCQEPFRKPSRAGGPPPASAGFRSPISGLHPAAAAAPRVAAPAIAAPSPPGASPAASPSAVAAAPRGASPAFPAGPRVDVPLRASAGNHALPPAIPGDRAGPMLSFYDAAAANARNTVILFAALFAAFFALGGAIGLACDGTGAGVALALALFAILASAAWFSGASIVLSAHGAREAHPERHRVLLNVVEEMTIAAGLPMPRVYVMETEGMNAFAAGRKPGEAVVAVTTGLVDRLSREELQGVVAHEMAHIKSRDTLYNICAAVLVGAVALLSDMFLRGSFFRGRGPRAVPAGGTGGRTAGKGGAAYFLLGILLAVLAPLAAKLLQMSISRQREYHADAAAAGFTRNPLGLASALEKIVQGGAGVPGDNRGTQHLFIVNPLRPSSDRASALTATHPPTERRIKRLKSMAGVAASS